jgi:hypothetical protein
MHQMFISVTILEKLIWCNAFHRQGPKEHATPQHFVVMEPSSKLTSYIFENTYYIINVEHESLQCLQIRQNGKFSTATNKTEKKHNYQTTCGVVLYVSRQFPVIV